MKRTTIATLVGLLVLGFVAAYLTQLGLASASLAKLRPEFSFSFSLALIATLVVTMAIPVWRSSRGRGGRRVDPFVATRVVVVAKASSVAGAVLTGAGAGLLLEVLTRPVPAAGEVVLRVVLLLVTSVALAAAGLISELLCTVPPDDDDPPDGSAAR